MVIPVPIVEQVWEEPVQAIQTLLRYSKTCLKRPLKNRQNKDDNDKRQLNEGQKYCRMLPLEHSAILLTCIKR